MMAFTDDDLKRLKDLIAADHEVGEIGSEAYEDLHIFFNMNIRTLLTRLESSETQRDVFREMYERKCSELDAMKNRLKAAEQALMRSWKGHTTVCSKGKNLSGGPGSCICSMGDLYMKWRKAAGK